MKVITGRSFHACYRSGQFGNGEEPFQKGYITSIRSNRGPEENTDSSHGDVNLSDRKNNAHPTIMLKSGGKIGVFLTGTRREAGKREACLEIFNDNRS